MWCCSGLVSESCVGGDLGGGLFAELDVPAEAAQVQMPGFGLEFGGGASVGGQGLEGGVAEQVERPALLVRVVGGGGLLEQVLGARVGQPAASGLRADVRLGRGSRPPPREGTPTGTRRPRRRRDPRAGGGPRRGAGG